MNPFTQKPFRGLPASFWLFVLISTLVIITMFMPACALSVPLGQDGRYGRIYGGYEPPIPFSTKIPSELEVKNLNTDKP